MEKVVQLVERGEQKLVEKEVDLEDCIPYSCGYNGKKAHWRRTESEMYKKVKASLKIQGMVNPFWVFETAEGKYRIVKGSCRAIASWDLLQEGDESFKKVKILMAPLGISRRLANVLFRSSEYKDVFMVNGELFPKGF